MDAIPRGLTEAQAAVLRHVVLSIQMYGTTPTITQLAKATQRGRSTVHEHLQALRRKGYLRRRRKGARELFPIVRGRRAPGRCPFCASQIGDPYDDDPQ